MTVLALAAGCLLGLVHVVGVIGLHVPFDPNEGWNAYFAQMATTRGSPYPSDGGFLVNNYPPLSFYAIGEFGRLVGDNIVAGRVVSQLALLVTAFGISAAMQRMGCTRLQSAFASLLFVACVLRTSDYAGMNDPQLLGHAIAIWGLVVALSEPRTARAMALAALLFTLAFFVKHNLVFLPLSLAGWLLLADRRQAVTFIASAIVFSLIGLGVFRVVFGTSLLHEISSARISSLDNLVAGTRTWLSWAAVPLCGAAVLYYVARRDRFVVMAIVYAVVATAGGLLLLGGTGVDANALFDADIALAMCAGLLLGRLEDRIWSAGTAIAYVIPLLLGLRSVEGDWASTAYWRHPMAQERITAAGEIALLRASREPVLCEMLALCYWAGKTPQVDVFNTDQRIRTGAQSASSLVRLIAGRRFSIIQLESLRPFPLPPAVERAVRHNYRIVRSDDERVFLAPR